MVLPYIAVCVFNHYRRTLHLEDTYVFVMFREVIIVVTAYEDAVEFVTVPDG
jgi:hypothetical protein